MLHMNYGIDILDAHAMWNAQVDRSIIQNCLYAGLYKLVGCLLSIGSRDGDHRNSDTRSLYACYHFRAVQYFKFPNFSAYLLRVTIKNHFDMESAISKTLIASKRAAQVSRTDNDHVPITVYFEDPLKLICKILDIVSCTLLTEFTELGKIFTNLRR